MRKGQQANPETVRKHRETMQAQFVSRLKIGRWEEYLDVKLTHFNTKKSVPTLTLREYFDLVKSGLSTKDVANLGYDRHLGHFYNKLLQDEILLDKQEFEKLYVDVGMPLDEICKKYHIDRDYITFLRELYGIKRKGALYIQRKRTECPLTDLQKELIYGSLLGDGKKGSASSFSIKHSSKQEEYLMWKHAILKNVASVHSLQKQKTFDPRYGHDNECVRFYTHANSDIEVIISKFYSTGKKIVTRDILDHLTPLSVAVWYMDDGVIDWAYRSRKFGQNTKPTARLCTDSFTKQECEIIQTWFWDKFKISADLKKRDKKKEQYRIRFNAVETPKFLAIVEPYIIPSMRYKVDYDAYMKHRKALGLETRYYVKYIPKNSGSAKTGEVFELPSYDE